MPKLDFHVNMVLLIFLIALLVTTCEFSPGMCNIVWFYDFIILFLLFLLIFYLFYFYLYIFYFISILFYFYFWSSINLFIGAFVIYALAAHYMDWSTIEWGLVVMLLDNFVYQTVVALTRGAERKGIKTKRD